ncbi:MAG: AbrB/MazE/SpoVT family DNA-binding domain-containing protein [Candidatus Kapabacteria bacterium]|nr:AbrB/MazE/SpoVT family DNA-binding domain-containing protein [Candidatus Kapabacteria bacterium]
MKARIQKWGNSMALRIPKIVIDEMGLGDNRLVELHLQDGELIVRAVETPDPYALVDLVKDITPETRHQIIEFDGPQGKEVW